jgi:hypothetical protein
MELAAHRGQHFDRPFVRFSGQVQPDVSDEYSSTRFGALINWSSTNPVA